MTAPTDPRGATERCKRCDGTRQEVVVQGLDAAVSLYLGFTPDTARRTTRPCPDCTPQDQPEGSE